ncbi:MAG: hypothetical protein HY744_27460 [Deltaproteobacteria bacterium]|nr:hypothetical protein [Deltaproteobacteria bacterium]
MLVLHRGQRRAHAEGAAGTARRAPVLSRHGVVVVAPCRPPAHRRIGAAVATLRSCAVAAGDGHTCALKAKADSMLWCRGSNYHGQLGDGTTQDKSSPVQIPALGGCQ